MIKNTLLSGLLATALGLGLTGMSVTASASVIQCSSLDPDISSQVDPNAGCEILEPIDANVNDTAAVVNTGGFFGATALDPDSLWTFGGKYLEAGGSPMSGVSITGTALSGTWTVDQAVLDMYEIMFIFKDGGDTNLVGYLINTTAGTYASPFLFPPFVAENGDPELKNISHVSVYYRDSGGPPATGPVPEPGTVTLLGLGLLGAVFYRRRLQQKNS